MKVLRLVFIISLVILAAQAAHADLAAITVSPVTRSITLSKKESQSGTYAAYNKSDEVQHVSVKPRCWYMPDENKSIPLESWLEVSPKEFDIAPGERKEVAYTVTVPEEAVGELAAMIAFEPERKEGQAVNVIFSVSLYVRITGSEDISYAIDNFKLWKLEDRDALGIKLSLKNKGNVHLKPNIMVYVQNLFNKNLQKADLVYGAPVYPGKIKDYDGAIYNFKLKPGLYKAYVYTEFADLNKSFVKKIYFAVGKNGKVLLTFFRRPKD